MRAVGDEIMNATIGIAIDTTSAYDRFALWK